MARRSRKPTAGILLYRVRNREVQVMLAHPGSPFSKHADVGVWTIPKGAPFIGETLEDCALREFEEEIGARMARRLVPLARINQSGKVLWAFACEGDLETQTIRSRLVQTEFPPGSKRWVSHAEIDRCHWFTLSDARQRLTPSQLPLLDRLIEMLQRA